MTQFLSQLTKLQKMALGRLLLFFFFLVIGSMQLSQQTRFECDSEFSLDTSCRAVHFDGLKMTTTQGSEWSSSGLLGLGWFKLILVASFLAHLLSSLFESSPSAKGRIFSLGLFALAMFFPDFRQQLLGKGLLGSEAWACLSLFFALFYLSRFLLREQISDIAKASFTFALSVLANSHLESLNMAILLSCLLGLLLWTGFQFVAHQSRWKKSFQLGLQILGVLFLFQLILSPIKLYNLKNHSIYSVTPVSKGYLKTLWTTDDKLPTSIPFSNTGCKTLPGTCAKINEGTAISDATLQFLTLSIVVGNAQDWLDKRTSQWKAFLLVGNSPLEMKLLNSENLSWGWQRDALQVWVMAEFLFQSLMWLSLFGILIFSGYRHGLSNQLVAQIAVGSGVLLVSLLYFIYLPAEPRYFLYSKVLGWYFLVLNYSLFLGKREAYD